MQPRIVVLGAAGMLGHKMFQHLQSRFPATVGIMRRSRPAPWQSGDLRCGVDAARFDELAALLREIRPDYLVNCVGIVKQRPEAQDPVLSIRINSLLPHRLAALAEEWRGRLIHFSSDCVFSGARGCYREEDPSDAKDLYGHTKFLGEVHSWNALTLRTSIIGRELSHRQSLLEWYLSRNGRPVKGFTRVIWSGITTNYAARLVSEILLRHPELSGLYHAAGNRISKHDLLGLLSDEYRLNIQIIPDDNEASDRSLVAEKLRHATGLQTPPWPEMIRELASDPTPYESGIPQ
jgi:dTDP-4-dehydrorhamnose reductase